MKDVIKIQENDNVAIALKDLKAGQSIQISGEEVTLREDIGAGHKFAIQDIEKGSKIYKYGYSIGVATEPIKRGVWIHTHNVKTGLGELLTYQYQPMKETVGKEDTASYFQGYLREDGKVGIRNEIWIIPTVGCVNDIARTLERMGKENLTPEVDEIVALTHPYGCSQLGDDQLNTQKILSGLVKHPNAAGILVLGLGCENNSIEEMKKQIGPYQEERVKFLVCQDLEDEIGQGMEYIKELIRFASRYKRESIPASELIVGLKCGGSDGLSGITANPAVGAFSDILIAQGGTTILTEVPEMFGAETILMNRCANEELFEKTVTLINDFKQYYMDYNQPIYENPSPGNKKGGISTLEDKSLGCTQKSGKSPVKGVVSYGEQVIEKGLNLLSGPGNDIVAATALAAAGAHIVLFTTGRGTPFGSQVPTVKISSNTPLYQKKGNWIDFDAGRLVSDSNLEELSSELFRYVLEVASGKKVKSEENGYRDMAIFKQGVTL
jgi:altronate hydrolase